MRRFAAFAAVFAFVLALGAPQVLAAKGPKNKDNDTHVQLLAINDFHGNLKPPSGSSGRISVGPGGATVDAGGVEYLATHVKRLRAQNPDTITVGAGDLIGASPLVSGLFHDEPTIEAMNLLGLDVSGVGNHEFDEGVGELLRMQFGGCHPVDGCQDGDPFAGSFFEYLAANVFYALTDRTILPSYEIKQVRNTKVAFIGLTLEGTPLIVTPAGVAGLEFRDEVETVNALVDKLDRGNKIGAFVVLLHEGGQQNAPYPLEYQDVNRCDNLSGPINAIADGLSDAIDVVISAHTHQPYVCNIDGKLVTSASSFGRLITDIDLVIDHQSKDVKSKTAHNVIVTRTVEKDPAQTALIAKYDAISAPLANRVVGSITTDITRTVNFAQETALGDVIADAQLASTSPTDFGGAVVAFMNPGGIRAELTYNNSPGGELPGQVTYGELFDVQPFNNVMFVKTMTGDMIRRLLEQQFDNPGAGQIRLLQVSNGFTYTYDFTQPAGSRIVPGSIKIDGTAIDSIVSYRVAMNNFLASGGDGFSVFNEGTDQLGGEIDLDALVNYFLTSPSIAPGPQNRVTRIG